MHSEYAVINPRFDFERALFLLEKHTPPSDVIAATVRLGDHALKRQIEAFLKDNSKAAHPTIAVAPLKIDPAATLAWRSSLDAATRAPSKTEITDAAVAAVAMSHKRTTWQERLRHEIKVVDAVLATNSSSLTGVLRRNADGERLSVHYPQLGSCDVLKRLHAETRHAITRHRLLSLDLSAAHPSVALGALVSTVGAVEAQRRCPTLHLVVTDRAAAVSRVQQQTQTSGDGKRRLLAALNQTENDEYHASRPPFIKRLIKERAEMEEALLNWPPLASLTGRIKAKAEQSGKGATLLSLLMQSAENLILETAIPHLRASGWSFVAPVGDASLLEPTRSGLDCNAAAAIVVEAARSLGVDVKVKVEHTPV
jgi:hypothetical protein